VRHALYYKVPPADNSFMALAPSFDSPRLGLHPKAPKAFGAAPGFFAAHPLCVEANFPSVFGEL